MPADLAGEVRAKMSFSKTDRFATSRSETCPTCRNKATTGKVLRIFLNLLVSEGNSQDQSVLQYKVDSLEFQLKVKEKDIETNEKLRAKDQEKLRALR